MNIDKLKSGKCVRYVRIPLNNLALRRDSNGGLLKYQAPVNATPCVYVTSNSTLEQNIRNASQANLFS